LSVFVHFQLSCEINALFAPIPGEFEELYKKMVMYTLNHPVSGRSF